MHETVLTAVRRAASGAGSHRESSSSLSALISTLLPCLALAGLLVGLFLLLRTKQKGLYAPRTYHDTLTNDEKTPPASQSMLGWLSDFRHIDDQYILQHHSLDGYLFVRFLKMIVFISVVGCCITWPILLPVNITGGGGQSGLDILSLSNVENSARYFAHALIAWVFFGFVMFVIARETLYLAKTRQAYLLSTWSASRTSQRTVLFTNVPENMCSHDCLQSMFKGVAQIWLVLDTSELEDDIEELNDATLKLEKDELKMIQQFQKAGGNFDRSMRPTSRLKSWTGEKVDTIEHGRQSLSHLLPKIQHKQQSYLQGKGKIISAVFIEFKTLTDAQVAQSLTIHDQPASFVSRQMGILPNEIIWNNLRMNEWHRTVRHALATALIAAMILFWSIPVALVGIISNVNYLTANVTFLAWIDDIPPLILGVVTGLLPTVLLAVLMALVPIICRKLSKLAGAVTLSEVELQTQSWYFTFQVIQVFLVTTFSSGATAVASQIASDPTQAVPLLAKNLPKASNFYISYFIIYGVAQSSRYLFNLMGLVGVFISSKFAKTPRDKYEKYAKLKSPSWGSGYPKWTNMGVIAISYAIISPLVLGFSAIGMGLVYLAYRYNMLYVYNTQIDTKGACYGRALEQLMVGVYLAEICLLGLFGIGIGDSSFAVGPAVLQVILIVGTVAFHITLRSKLSPLLETLPINLLRDSEHYQNLDRHATTRENGDAEEQHRTLGQDAKNEGLVSSPGKAISTTHDIALHANHPPTKQSLFGRLFAPHRQSTAALSSFLGPSFRLPVPLYSDDHVRHAYLHPAITMRPPVIWLARDKKGISTNEIKELTELLGDYGVVATDDGAVVNDKGKIEWVGESVRDAPLWEEKGRY
ncbi:putative DUF221 domain protein [Pleomassaria siparia CBS 279.74]|uniref:Putative DUF221 domain protein n=1 Tax=Pleomassaria siparia CBS 279.74 TaxID=1314801 RepID=A0A6G1KQM2_9PLEO|nr:putative DUF221 domain protein [Pleomassaria siparia CBS 279.74]